MWDTQHPTTPIKVLDVWHNEHRYVKYVCDLQSVLRLSSWKKYSQKILWGRKNKRKDKKMGARKLYSFLVQRICICIEQVSRTDHSLRFILKQLSKNSVLYSQL